VLPAGAHTLAGTVRAPVDTPFETPQVAVSAFLTTDTGAAWRVPLADGGAAVGFTYQLQIAGLRLTDAGGAPLPLPVDGSWRITTAQGPGGPARVAGTGLDVIHRIDLPDGALQFARQPSSRFAVVPAADDPPVPALVTPGAAAALNVRTGDTVDLPLSGVSLPVKVVGQVAAVPGTAADGVLLDLPAATNLLLRQQGTIRPVAEWWLGADAGGHAAAAEHLAGFAGTTLLDRRQVAAEAARDPYWRGARTGLLAAALGSVLLALVGLAVDVWATTRHRLAEFAVLHTLGANARLLARALLAEQAFLAGIGVGVGLLVGAGVAATMVPLVILTPAAGRPVPEAVFTVPWSPVGLTAAGLLLAALAFAALITTGIRRRVSAAQLRIGGER
ncbi:ABC transporter permease, partial [Micromonospora sp. MH33]|uniref:FtsX-like permease family protein n=1 Tax=Micromonospora sp. MH33 TaxID=1945509 RepID=UPI0011B1E9F5